MAPPQAARLVLDIVREIRAPELARDPAVQAAYLGGVRT